MRESVYFHDSVMANIKTVKRYIDDGSGFFGGTVEQFTAPRL
jgi:hypothetical protein